MGESIGLAMLDLVVQFAGCLPLVLFHGTSLASTECGNVTILGSVYAPTHIRYMHRMHGIRDTYCIRDIQ